jgi:hypothetical protein
MLAIQRTTYPVFHCSRHDYKSGWGPVGYANTEAEACKILAAVFEGTCAEASIAVELAAVYLGRRAVWAYWPAANSSARRRRSRQQS